jgi:Mitochondrial small ribosomal subunit Rsm22
MIGLDLVRPLEDDWRDVLDVVARAHGWPSSAETDRLGAAVAALSREYNRRGTRGTGRPADELRLAARLGFSFPRDVPKGAAAVRELVALHDPGKGALRVLDVGAGLGATSWGVARALRARRRELPVVATWVDCDATALDVGVELVRERARLAAGRGPHAGAEVEVRSTHACGVTAWRTAARGERFDLVLLGQVLSELDVEEPEPGRTTAHAELLGGLLDEALEPHGSLVVVEPALRDRTRHLHALRDAMVARGATVFAPCLHAAPCPALEIESEWCHEDLDVDLPSWLVPVARAAGLRREGLSFSYLVLRKDEVTLASRAGARLRVVSRPLPSKGKCELYLCGTFARVRGGEEVAARAKVMRLARDENGIEGLALGELARGELVVVEPTPELGSRLPPEARIETIRARKTV